MIFGFYQMDILDSDLLDSAIKISENKRTTYFIFQ